jgi:plasmid stability protein
MPGLLIKDVPDDLHQRLKESAARHHRSLTKEAMALLEEALAKEPRRKDLPQPFQGQRPVTQDLLDQAKAERR